MSAKQSQGRRHRPASSKVTPSARSARASPSRRFYDMGHGTEISTATLFAEHASASLKDKPSIVRYSFPVPGAIMRGQRRLPLSHLHRNIDECLLRAMNGLTQRGLAVGGNEPDA